MYNHLQKKFRRRRESRVKTSRKTEPLRAFSGKVHPVIATESTRKGSQNGGGFRRVHRFGLIVEGK